METDLRHPLDDDPPAEGGAAALPVWVARLEERLVGVDRLYRHQFNELEKQVAAVEQKVEVQQKWIQGTAVLVGLEVLGLLIAILTGWRP